MTSDPPIFPCTETPFGMVSVTTDVAIIHPEYVNELALELVISYVSCPERIVVPKDPLPAMSCMFRPTKLT